ncbi:MAG TPA: hypothetical protein VFR18_02455 [Terriglobia bacterium]|nr:hypothetical protein [Terriglobia bacterium]
MKRISLHISITVILLMLVLTTSPAAPQAGSTRPLTWEQVLEYWKAESAETLRRNITRERVTQNGVAFALDEAREKELLRLKMSADLISEIKKQNRMGTLVVECEPACSVSVNNETGRPAARQTSTPVIAGTMTLAVTAPDYRPKNETLKIGAGEVVRRSFKLDPVLGSLELECEPDCTASINGPNGYRSTMSTTKGRGLLEELPDGEYSLQVEAEGFRPAESKVVVRSPNTANAHFKLAADEWAGKSAVDVVELMTQKVGPLNLVYYAITSKNDGQMTLKGDPASIGNWTAELVEAAVPTKLRWEMKVTSRKWTVTFDGTTARSNGDKRFAGTEFSMELEQAIRNVTDLRLPAVLIKIRSGFDLKKGRAEGSPVLVATSDVDRYTFFVDQDFVPRRILHERLKAPTRRVEAEFNQYRQVMPDLRLPHVMTLRYPERPKHEQVFEYKVVDPGLALKDSYFTKP